MSTAAFNFLTPKPSARRVLITPEMAREMLERNTCNRTLNDRRVGYLLKEIVAGNWLEDGNPIRFGADGRLYDGQHRLVAIARSGISCWALVVEGLPENSRWVIDTGRARTAGDALGILGVKDRYTVAAVARHCLTLSKAGPSATLRGTTCTHTDVINWVENNQDVHQAARLASRLYESLGVPRSGAALGLLLCMRASPQLFPNFWTQLHTGADLAAGDPVLACRSWMAKLDSSTRAASRNTAYVIARTFEAKMRGKELRGFRPERDGAPSPIPFTEVLS